MKTRNFNILNPIDGKNRLCDITLSERCNYSGCRFYGALSSLLVAQRQIEPLIMKTLITKNYFIRNLLRAEGKII